MGARTLEILAVPSAVLCRRSGCSRGQQRLRASPNVFSGFREIVGPLMKKGKKKCRSLDFVVVLFSIVFALSRNATKYTARIVPRHLLRALARNWARTLTRDKETR